MPARLIIGVVVAMAAATTPGADLHSRHGQQAPGFAGRVSDSAGAALSGVIISVYPESGGVGQATTTARDGSYSIGVPGGSYRVVFDLEGFHLLRRNGVRARIAEVVRLDAVLDVAPLCECIEWAGPQNDRRGPDLRERSGQVLDESGLPVPHASLGVASETTREQAYADREGRFRVRLSARRAWPFTAVATGFEEQTEEVRGDATAPIVFRLRRTAPVQLAEVERLPRGCRCDSDLFRHSGRSPLQPARQEK